MLSQVISLYHAELVSENKLGNSANSIYEIRILNKPGILRISKHTLQKEQHVNFELAWMHDLAQHMQQIAGPIPSLNGRLFEVIDADTDRWIACVFHKAPGHMVDPANPLEWNEALFRKLGKLMGNLHTHTKPYVARVGIHEQLDWRHGYEFWPENNQWTDPDILPAWNQTLAEMESLSKREGDYGIVHTDIHHQNFHIADGNIVLFDFDDCAYSWYAYDLASTLFFMALAADYREADSGKEVMERFGEPFLQGYGQSAQLPAHWMQMLPLFLRYRRLAQYNYFTNLFYGQANPHEAYLAWAKDDILSGFPYLQYDFSRCRI